MRKWTEVLKQFLDKHGNTYDYSKVVFKNMNTKIEIQCKLHGPFFQDPKNHIKGQKCPKCSKSFKTSINTYLNLLKTKYKNYAFTYDIIPSDICIDKKTIINCNCKKHGDFTVKLSSHLNTKYCPECMQIDKDILYTKSVKNKSKYNILTEIFNKNSIIHVVCPNHGLFNIKANKLLTNKIPCPKCLIKHSGHNSITEQELIRRFRLIHNDTYKYDNLNYMNAKYPVTITCKKHGNFKQITSNHLKGQGCKKCSQAGISKAEKEISKLIPKSELNTRKIISPFELDIYSHIYKFAIEYNGLIWHSFGKNKSSKFNNYELEYKDKYKHLTKTELCETKDIQLFHIFENEWLNLNKQNIWKSIIKSKFDYSEQILENCKCCIKEINSKESSEFLKLNHLEGTIESDIIIGLFYEQELVQVMLFKLIKDKEYELTRFSTKNGLNIELNEHTNILRYFEINYKPSLIKSSVNRRWNMNSEQIIYRRLGFKYIGTTDINYFYIDTKVKVLESKNKYQKHKLKEILTSFDINLTETENMYNNNYRKIYDSGNLIYIKEY